MYYIYYTMMSNIFCEPHIPRLVFCYTHKLPTAVPDGNMPSGHPTCPPHSRPAPPLTNPFPSVWMLPALPAANPQSTYPHLPSTALTCSNAPYP